MTKLSQEKIEIIYVDEKYLTSFHQSLDLVAREKIYLEMVEALPFEKIREHQRKIIQNNLPGFFAIYQDRVIGWVDVMTSSNPRQSHRGTLGMGILAEFRGQGLGTRLMEAAIEHARKIGLEKLELEVYSSNPRALALYKKMGFQEVGYKRNQRKLEGRYFDIILMDLMLTAIGAGISSL